MTGADHLSEKLSQARRMLLAMAGAMFLLGTLTPGLAASVAAAQSKTVVIPVQGMVCIACAGTVKTALKSIAGVSRVEVSLEKRTAEVTYAPEKLSPDQLVAAINKAGYKAGPPKEIQ